jgi:hypothetical protein
LDLPSHALKARSKKAGPLHANMDIGLFIAARSRGGSICGARGLELEAIPILKRIYSD